MVTGRPTRSYPPIKTASRTMLSNCPRPRRGQLMRAAPLPASSGIVGNLLQRRDALIQRWGVGRLPHRREIHPPAEPHEDNTGENVKNDLGDDGKVSRQHQANAFHVNSPSTQTRSRWSNSFRYWARHYLSRSRVSLASMTSSSASGNLSLKKQAQLATVKRCANRALHPSRYCWQWFQRCSRPTTRSTR